MANLLEDMKNLNLQNRTVGLMENGTWAPMAGKQMRAALEGMKRMRILEPAVTVKSALKADSRAAIGQLADTILADLVQEA